MTATLVLEDASRRCRYTVSADRPVVVGRTPDNDVSIPEMTVSRHHARISFANERWLVEDVHSSGGTWVNGQLVRAPTILADGDIIQLSSAVQLRVSID